MKVHDWRTEVVNIASAKLADALTRFEQDGWEIFQILARTSDEVLVVTRRPK